MRTNKFSDHIYIIDIDPEYVALFNNISGDIAFVAKKLFTSPQVDKVELLIKNNLSPNNLLLEEKLGKGKLNINKEISLVRVLFTDLCNFACKYCKVIPNTNNITKQFTPQNNLIKVFDILLESKYKGPKIVHFSGGEPLIYKEEVLKNIKYINQKDKNHQIICVIGTNGYYLNKSWIEKAVSIAPNIKFIISLDGKKQFNDIMRRTANDKPTFDIIDRNIRMLMQYDIEFGISMVVGQHNIGAIDENISYIIDTYSPSSLGVNIMKPPTFHQEDFAYLVSEEEYVKNLYPVFKKVREKGVYIELISRKVEPLAFKKFRYYDCGASSGSTINIDAKGNVGPCKSFLVSDMVSYTEYEKMQNELKEKWNGRNVIENQTCKDCPALFICGNGCAYDAYIKHQNLFEIDQRHCAYSKLFLDEILQDLFEICKGKIISREIYVPDERERMLLFGNAAPHPFSLKWSIGHAIQ